MKLLLTDPLNRIPFDVYNIVKRNHPELGVVLVGPDDVASRMRARLAYGARLRRLRKDAYAHFEVDLHEIVEEFGDEPLVYFPFEEDTTALFYEFVAHHGHTSLRYNLPERSRFELARDKKEVSRFCSRHGIPVPREFSREDLRCLRKDFVPLIAKPRIGKGGRGLISIDRPDQLPALARLGDDYLIQERLPHPREVRGAFYLFHRGRMISCYGHRRIRTYPSRGGVTVLARVDHDPLVLDTGRRLLEALGWSGVAMVELLYDPRESCWKVIEINPRAWGSFLLSEFCGAAFLENYVNTAVGRPPTEASLREDVSIHWLVPYGLLQWVGEGMKIDRERTCYVGFTHSTVARSLGFLVGAALHPARLGGAARKARQQWRS